jgi:hypothetical protein
MVSGLGVHTRLACPEDLEEIGRLLPDLGGSCFTERFPGKTVADFCRWKYFENPAGLAAVGIAVDKGRVVSLVAAVPKLVQLGSEIALTFELGDFITTPEYRKRGLFSHLIQMVCREAAERQAAFVYVRPNPTSFRILTNSLSFLEAQKIDERRYLVPSGAIHRKTGLAPDLVRALGVDWIAQRFLLPPVDGSVAVKSVARFDAGIDEFWTSVRNRYSYTLVRDSQNLNWRYTDCPTPFLLWTAHRQGRVTGYLVAFAFRAESKGFIADLFTAPEDAETAASLLRTGMESLLTSGVQAVYTWTLQSGAESAAATLLERACPIAAKPCLHFAIRFLDPRMDASRLPSNCWHLALGDFDSV